MEASAWQNSVVQPACMLYVQLVYTVLPVLVAPALQADMLRTRPAARLTTKKPLRCTTGQHGHTARGACAEPHGKKVGTQQITAVLLHSARYVLKLQGAPQDVTVHYRNTLNCTG